MVFSAQANARSKLIRLGALVLLLLLLNGLIGLAAIRYSNQTSLSDLDQLAAIERVQDLTQAALLDFKRQVQEWKNTLLRGDEPVDLAKYRAAFDRNYEAVQQELAALASAVEAAQLTGLELAEVITQHAQIKRRYDAALATFVERGGGSPRLTDAMVRGIDRDLSATLDQIGSSAMSQTFALREAIRISAAERYRNILLYTTIANVLIAALVIVILLIALNPGQSR